MGNVVNRVFDSSGPDGKVRGTPQQIIDKYTQLARDAQLGNDRVAFENFQQHAEHYQRMLSEAQREQEQKREQQERENRERQSQRDRERNEREGDDQNTGQDGSDQQDGDQRGKSEDGAQDNQSGQNDQPRNDPPRKKRGKPQNQKNDQGQDSQAPQSSDSDGFSEAVDFGGGNDDSHLVETPESAEKPKARRASKPRKKAAEADTVSAEEQPASDTADNG